MIKIGIFEDGEAEGSDEWTYADDDAEAWLKVHMRPGGKLVSSQLASTFSPPTDSVINSLLLVIEVPDEEPPVEPTTSEAD